LDQGDSQRRDQGGDCVEMRRNGDAIEVRHSKDPDGGILRYSPVEWARGSTAPRRASRPPDLRKRGARPAAQSASRAILHVQTTWSCGVLSADPHARALDWRPPGIATITEPVPLGLFEDATQVGVLLLRRHG
jgi:Domain of unknown function (DUF397)